MPRSIYIICCQAGSDDRFTGATSHFNVYDRLEIFPRITGSGGPIVGPTLPLRITAVWMPEDADLGADYECELRIFLPPHQTEWTAYSGRFQFESGVPRKRFTFNVPYIMFNGPGQLLVENRIRKLGESDWLTQNYPIDVVFAESQQANPTSPEIDRGPVETGPSVPPSLLS
jgi:hypothetical protein